MSEPKKFRKKPVVIEAMRWTGALTDPFGDGHALLDWFGRCGMNTDVERHGEADVWHLFINTLEGRMEANPGDYIIRGVQGEFYPCKPEIFAATYEEVGHD